MGEGVMAKVAAATRTVTSTMVAGLFPALRWVVGTPCRALAVSGSGSPSSLARPASCLARRPCWARPAKPGWRGGGRRRSCLDLRGECTSGPL
jgi:hypothetical protein